MKAVILARGLGKRMREAGTAASIDAQQAAVADQGIKAMIPVGRPFLDYVLSALADAECRDVCLVIGPEHTTVREYYERPGLLHRVHVSFAIQERPLGTADAILAAERFAGEDRFLVMNADNYYPVAAYSALRDIGEDGYLQRIVEKPDDATARAMSQTAFVSMNVWAFDKQIFEPCRTVRLSP